MHFLSQMDAIGLILSSGILNQSSNIKLMAIPFPVVSFTIPQNGTIYSDYYDIPELVGANAIGVFYSIGLDGISGSNSSTYDYYKYIYFYTRSASDSLSEVYTRMDLYSKYSGIINFQMSRVSSTTINYYIYLYIEPSQNFRYRFHGVMQSGTSPISVSTPQLIMLMAAFY